MSNVVKLQRPEVIWVCGCGCASFELRGDGESICRECGLMTDGAGGAWFERIKGVDATTDESPRFSDAGNDDGGELARRRSLRSASQADWIVCGKDDGFISEWARIRLPADKRAELQEQIDEGVRLLMKDLAIGQDD